MQILLSLLLWKIKIIVQNAVEKSYLCKSLLLIWAGMFLYEEIAEVLELLLNANLDQIFSSLKIHYFFRRV